MPIPTRSHPSTRHGETEEDALTVDDEQGGGRKQGYERTKLPKTVRSFPICANFTSSFRCKLVSRSVIIRDECTLRIHNDGTWEQENSPKNYIKSLFGYQQSLSLPTAHHRSSTQGRTQKCRRRTLRDSSKTRDCQLGLRKEAKQTVPVIPQELTTTTRGSAEAREEKSWERILKATFQETR